MSCRGLWCKNHFIITIALGQPEKIITLLCNSYQFPPPPPPSPQFDSPWTQVNAINLKFQDKGGGGRQVFTKPSVKKQKMS